MSLIFHKHVTKFVKVESEWVSEWERDRERKKERGVSGGEWFERAHFILGSTEHRFKHLNDVIQLTRWNLTENKTTTTTKHERKMCDHLQCGNIKDLIELGFVQETVFKRWEMIFCRSFFSLGSWFHCGAFIWLHTCLSKKVARYNFSLAWFLFYSSEFWFSLCECVCVFARSYFSLIFSHFDFIYSIFGFFYISSVFFMHQMNGRMSETEKEIEIEIESVFVSLK